MEYDAGHGKPAQQSKFHFDNMHWKDPIQYGPILLYQIGDLGCEGGYTTGAHKQFCHEISYIVSGKGIFSTNDVKYNVRKGDVYLSHPGELHDVVADKIDPLRYFYAAFCVDAGGGESGDLASVVSQLDNVHHPVASDKYDLQAPFINIFNELIAMNDFSGSMIASCLAQLIILACRDFHEGARNEYSPKNTMEHTKKIVYEVINYIDTNLCRITDLPDICRRFDYSYSYLSHIFSHEIGLSMQDYYDRKRFETAAKWLTSTSMSITEIAEKLQYQSIHSFSRAFKLYFGLPPTKFKAEHLDNH